MTTEELAATLATLPKEPPVLGIAIHPRCFASLSNEFGQPANLEKITGTRYAFGGFPIYPDIHTNGIRLLRTDIELAAVGGFQPCAPSPRLGIRVLCGHNGQFYEM